MTGLIVLGLIAAYVAMFVFVVRGARSRIQRVAAVLVAVLIPFWDLPFGYYNFREQCEADEGVAVFQQYPAQKSLYFVSFTGYEPEHFIKAGLDAVELTFSDGIVVRFSRGASGALDRTPKTIPRSDVRIRATLNERSSWSIVRTEHRLENNVTGQLLARTREYHWLGGWLFQLMPMPLPLASCNNDSLTRVVRSAVGGSSSR